jgi:hypothetical protein
MLTLSALLVVSPALAQEAAPDLSAALEVPKKAKWDPKGKTIGPFGRGDAKRKQEAWGEAIPLLVEALDSQPGCGKCLVSLAGALTGAGHFEDAVRVGELLNQLYPERNEGWRKISDAWTEAGMAREAIDATTKYLEVDKASSALWWRRNQLLLQLGAFDEANGFLEAAGAAGLEEKDIACLRVQLLAGQNEVEAAREQWASCSESESLDLKRYSEGWLAMAEGDTELAAKRMTMAGADDFARVTIALLRLEQEKPEMALNILAKLEHGGKWADAHLARALALGGVDKGDEALAELRDNGLGGAPSLTVEQVLLKPKGAEWPAEVARRAVILEISLLDASGDAEGAAALYEKAKAAYGESEDLAAVAPQAEVALPEK